MAAGGARKIISCKKKQKKEKEKEEERWLSGMLLECKTLLEKLKQISQVPYFFALQWLVADIQESCWLAALLPVSIPLMLKIK